jgi:AraC-like DNA-binding protein
MVIITSKYIAVTAAAHALRSGKQKIVDVALDFVFDSHEGFTRAFAKGFGISPKKLRNPSIARRLADTAPLSQPLQNKYGGYEHGKNSSGFYTNS